MCVCEVRNQINRRGDACDSELIKEYRSQNMKCNIFFWYFYYNMFYVNWLT